ncbi:terminase large subunit [Lutibacter aestuarii]|uniref:Terminase large subunit n=1 Tax=Lutibacter aestuarii TaxID=861111 RepID=A0ABW2Z8T0_9FLAO
MKITKQQKNSIPFQYAYDVLEGNIVVGKRVKQAVNRFFDWIEDALEDKFYLDHQKGMMVINFFEKFLTHTKGKTAGEPFLLSPFQQFTLYNLFGWMEYKPTGAIRRINVVYDKQAKKNGKTALMAGVNLFHLGFDFEEGAECYVGATKEEQAKLCFNQAAEFIKASSLLQKLGFRVLQKEIKFLPTNSFCKPLGGDSKTQDGINSSLSIIDEYHAHPTDAVKENLESSSASRKQPLIYHITTAGVNVAGVCKNFEDSMIAILDGIANDDHAFIMIHDLDEGDDWEDENNWVKANPNLGVTVTLDFLRKEFQKAKNQPSKAPNFKTKHLNMWVDAPEIWIPTEIWRKNNVNLSEEDYLKLFIKKAQKFGCFSGNDLSTRTDLSAHVLLTEPDEEGIRYLLPFIFCPKDTIDVRSKEDRVPYRYWADNGFLIATPGNRIDLKDFKHTLQINNKQFNIHTNEFDPWGADSLFAELEEDGVTNVSTFSQSIGIISYPTKQFEILIYAGLIKHNGHPIMEWALSGCVIIEDPNSNIKVHKGRSHSGIKRIDPIIAAIIALGGSLTPEEETKQSVYNNPNKEISFGIEN